MERSFDLPIPMDLPAETDRAFEELFNAYYPRLARLLYRATGDIDRAEELATEAFWRLHHKPPPSKSNVEGWLYRTGLRLALDQLKKERRRVRYESLASMFGAVITPEQAIEKDQERNRVRQTLAALKPEHASSLLLRSEGFSYAEIAEALNVNQASTGVMLARAEQAFRKEFVRRYGQR